MSKLLCTLIPVSLLLSQCGEGAAQTAPTCTVHEVTVQIEDSSEWVVEGELCVPKHGSDTVEVLVHGATYSRSYWDRHVEHALKRGHATFAYDRLGSGASGKPPGEIVNVEMGAFVNGQLVDMLQDGSLAAFDKVALVGHSFGSLITITSAATDQNVDVVVLTGFAHQATQQASDATTASVYPAMFDTKFAGQIEDPNYFTTIPGTREGLFFSHLVDDETLAQDEMDKDLMSLGLIFDIPRHFEPESLAIDVPVMMIMGTKDFMYCGENVDCNDPSSFQVYEENFFAYPVTTQMVNGAGHSLTLHHNTKITTNQIVNWIDSN